MKNSYLLRSYAWLVCGIGAVFYCYEYFLRITPSVMTNELKLAFGSISSVALGNLAAYYYYVYTPMQLPVGVLMDRFGPRRLLTFACLVCAAGAYLFAYTHDINIAALGRILMGFGSAFAFVGVLSLAAIWLPPQNFAFVAGMTTTLGMIGGMQGQVVLAKLVEEIGWRQTLTNSAHLGVILTFVIYLIVRDRKKNNEVQQDVPRPHVSFKTLIWGLVRTLCNKQILLAGMVGSLLYLSLSAFAELWGVSYLESVYHLTRVDAAKAVSMVFLGWAIGGPVIGYFSDRIERRVLPLVIGAVGATISSIIFLYVPELPMPLLCICLFAYGFFCSAEIVVFALGRENSSYALAGIGIATINMLVMIGGVITQPLVGQLLDIFVGENSSEALTVYPIGAYHKAMLILPVGTLIAAFSTFFLRETNCKVA